MTIMATETPAARLSRVILHDELPGDLPPMIEADRAQAVLDLEQGNFFAPRGAGPGPFVLILSVRDGRLLFDIRDESMQPITLIGLALGPLRRLIKDYVMMLDSYATAVQEGREARIQAIDMGRRGLHNEGPPLSPHGWRARSRSTLSRRGVFSRSSRCCITASLAHQHRVRAP